MNNEYSINWYSIISVILFDNVHVPFFYEIEPPSIPEEKQQHSF